MKNFKLFEKLWEHGRPLRRVGLVLVMCLMAIPQVWASTSAYNVASLASANSWTSNSDGSKATNGSSLNQTITNITYSFTNGSSKKTHYEYASSTAAINLFSDGNAITLSTSSSYKITAVEIVVNNKSNSPRWCGVVDGSSVAVSGSWLEGSSAYTVGTNINVATYTFTPTTAVAGGSLKFTIDKANGTTDGKVRITSITVTYQSVGTRKFKSGEKIYFKDAIMTNTFTGEYRTWKILGGDLYAYFYGRTDGGADAWTNMSATVSGTVNNNGAIYRYEVPYIDEVAYEWTGVIFVRGTSWTFSKDYGFWNQTNNQTPSNGYNLFKVKDQKDGNWVGDWARYSEYGSLVGDFNEWNPDANVFTDGFLEMEASASQSFSFKVLYGDAYWGKTSTSITSTTSDWISSMTSASGEDKNISFTADEGGTYIFGWDGTDHKVGVYYPKARFEKQKYIYLDTRPFGTGFWNSDNASYMFYFKHYHSGSDVADGVISSYNSNMIDDNGRVFPVLVPNSDNAGRIQLNRYNSAGNERWGADVSGIIYATGRSTSAENCMLPANSVKDGGWSDWTTGWTTYCPPMKTSTIADNGTVKTWGGSGTSGSPYLIAASSTIKVSASSTKYVNDANMEERYDFQVRNASGTQQAHSDGTAKAYDYSVPSTDNVTYKVRVNSYNSYNSTNSSATWSDGTEIYYTARTPYNIAYKPGANGTGDAVTDVKLKTINITLRGVTYTRTGYTQTAWNTDPSGTGGTSYSLSGSYTGNADITLYPTWTAKTTTITIDDNDEYHGSTTPGTITATYDQALSSFTAAAGTDGYQLKGYYTTATGGTKIINANGTLVASTTYTDGSGNWHSEEPTLTLYPQYELMDACYTFAPSAESGSFSANDIVTTSSGGIMEYTPVSGGNPTLGFTSTGLEFGGGSSCHVTVALENNMKVGTVIMATLRNTSTGTRGLKLYTGNGSSKLADFTYDGTGSDFVKTYTVTSSDGLEGTNVFQLWRSDNTYLKSIRVMNCGTAATTYDVSYSGDNASSSDVGDDKALSGGNYTATFAADDDYHLPDAITVTINSVSATENTDYYWDSSTGTFVVPGSKVTGDIAISFDAEPDGYAITHNSPTGSGTYTIQVDSEDPTGSSTTAAEGSTITLAASASTGYSFTSWTVTGATNGDDIEVTNNSFTMPAEAVTVDATFTIVDYTITHSAASNGTYTIKVGSASATDENTTANYNQTVALVATPSSGYVLSAWNVTGATVGNNNIASTSFTMPAGNVTVAPTFKLMPNVYYYQDATRYANSTYKNPKGETASSGDNQPINSGNEWTVSSITGLTVSAKGCTYDGKSGEIIYMTSYLKVPKDGNASDKYVKFVVATGYKATSLKMKIGGYSSNPAVTLKPYTTELGEAISYAGTVGGVATKENNFNEISWSNLAAGTYYLNVGTNAYISEITAQVTSTCTDAELEYETTLVDKTYGDAAFTNTLTNANSAVQYSSTTPAVATVNTTTGQVTIVGAGSTTIKATIADDATYCDDEVSYTLTVAKAAIGVTASTGSATNITQTGARLPITLTGTTANAASVTVKLYSSSDVLLSTYAGIATNATYKDVTGLTASTTYKYTITVIGDANHNDGTETAKQSFTTADPTYTITFADNGATSGDAMSDVEDIASGADVNLAANTWTKTEHTFAGWKTDVALTYVAKGGEDEVEIAVDGIVPDEATIKNVTGNITLTAQWQINSYSVYFLVGIDASVVDGFSTYEYGEEKALPTTVLRSGYLFDGWYANSSLTGDPVTQMPADATGTKYYYPKWKELSAKCLYITGDVIDAYNEVASDPGYYMLNDVKYVFGEGYDDNEDALVLPSTADPSYIYIDPKVGTLKEVQLHISDIADKNTADKGISWGFDEDDSNVGSVGLSDLDEISDHEFSFRPTDADQQCFVFQPHATTLTIDNICVFYEAKTYSVTYDDNGAESGSVPATATYYYNDVVTVQAGTDLEKEDYTFRGWFDGTTFYVVGDQFKITGNVTLKAVWQSDSGCEGRSVGSIFKMEVATSLTNGALSNDDGNFCSLTTSNYLSTLKGGTARAYNNNEHTVITGGNAIGLTNNDSYIEFTLPSAIQVGDVIIYTGASGVELNNSASNSAQVSIAAGTTVTSVVGVDNDLVGYSKIYMYRKDKSSTVKYFEVRRPVFYMSVGTPDAYSFPLGETAITTSNGLDVLVGGGAKAGCLTAGHMQLRGSSYYDLMFYTFSGGYLKLDLDNALAQGDIISFTVGSGSTQLAITTTDTWSDAIATSAKTYTIPAKSPLIGAETIYLWGKAGTSYAKTLSIIRAADAVSGGGEAICHFTVSFACKTGFEALDGRLPANTVGVPSGAHIGAPEDPFAIGYAFLGWYDDAACSDGHEVDFETLTITENTTIYAKWENNVHTFTGAAGTTAWETEGNWDAAGIPNSAYPYCYSQVYIKAPAEMAKDTKAHVGRLDIVNDRSSNTGQLTIASGAMLIVYDKVSRITNWSTKDRLATIADDIYIGSERDDDAYSWREQGALNGALIMGDYDRETQADSATVQFASLAYTKSSWTTVETAWGERDVNQYIGIPFAHAKVSDYKPYDQYIYTNVYLYEHDRWNNSWSPMIEKQDMSEFTGYDLVCFSLAPDDYTNPKPIFDMKGELASTAERRIHLREYEGYYGAEENETMLANSWTAPIDIASFEVSDFEYAEATIYMFNAGTSAEYDGNMEWASNYSTYPGQYTAIPINDLKLHPYSYEGYKTIPSMQSFSIIVLDDDGNSGTRHNNSYLTMDYKRLVYDPAVAAASVTTERMHAPRRVPTMEEEPLAIMLHVHGMSGMGDRIRILEREDFSFGRDNGWETSKLLGIIEAPSLYAVTEVGDQATVAVPDVEGLGLTFQAGEYDNVYTFNFEYDESEEPLYLLDKKTGIYTRVLTGNTYSFVTTDKNFNERFLLTRNYQMPEVATGLENTAVDSSLNERVQKVLINDMIYILRDGHIYDATGKMLK